MSIDQIRRRVENLENQNPSEDAAPYYMNDDEIECRAREVLVREHPEAATMDRPALIALCRQVLAEEHAL